MKNPKLEEFRNEVSDSVQEMIDLGYTEEEIDQFIIDQGESETVIFDPYCGGI